jgi:hypothetical protein
VKRFFVCNKEYVNGSLTHELPKKKLHTRLNKLHVLEFSIFIFCVPYEGNWVVLLWYSLFNHCIVMKEFILSFF